MCISQGSVQEANSYMYIKHVQITYRESGLQNYQKSEKRKFSSGYFCGNVLQNNIMKLTNYRYCLEATSEAVPKSVCQHCFYCFHPSFLNTQEAREWIPEIMLLQGQSVKQQQQRPKPVHFHCLTSFQKLPSKIRRWCPPHFQTPCRTHL